MMLPGRKTGYALKRVIDFSVALIGLSLGMPLLLILWIIVRVKLGSPVVFRQERPGLHGKPFMMYKFRTMTEECDAQGNLLPDADRLTPLGRFMRSTSLDELPELFNVLKGDMSLVGPRPLLMQYLARYTPEQARRHDVKPGITGWAQINGRQEISFSQRIAYDLWYIDKCSPWLDLKILLLTLARVFGKKGVLLAQDVTDVDDLGLYLPDNKRPKE
jgi:sugar transferase EpsL